MGGGSGGSPALRRPCPGAVVALSEPDAESGVVVDGDVGAAPPDAWLGEAGSAVGEGAASAAGLGCASVAGIGGGGGGTGADANGKPARTFSSLYFALVRSAIRLCVSLSRSAAVNARSGGDGTVARFG
jgi:hypothetical protein